MQDLAGRRRQLFVVIGWSVAPKNTVPLVSCLMPAPDPSDW